MSTPAHVSGPPSASNQPANPTQKKRYLKKKEKQREKLAAQEKEATLLNEVAKPQPITFAQVLKAPKPASTIVTAPKNVATQPSNLSSDATDRQRSSPASGRTTSTNAVPSSVKKAAPPAAASPKTFKKRKSKTTRTLAELLGLPPAGDADADDEAPLPLSALNVAAPAKKTLISYSIEAEKKTAANPVEVPKRGRVVNPNIMDNTTEIIVRRGKEREKPKTKRPSKLKRAILAERTRRYIEFQQAKLALKTQPEEAGGLATEEAEVPLENPESDLEGLGLSSDEATEAEEKEEKKKVELESTAPLPASISQPTPAPASAAAPAPAPASVPAVVREEPAVLPMAKPVAKPAAPAVPLPAKIPRVPNANPVREYCDQELSADLDQVVQTLLSELKRFQDRAFHKDPVKAKKRFVCGLKEVLRGVTAKKIKAIIVVPNLEECSAAGGLDELREQLMIACKKTRVPVVFALSRAKLGRAIGKNVRISVVGVYFYEGAQDHFTKMVEMSRQLRAAAKKKSAPPPPPSVPSTPATITLQTEASPALSSATTGPVVNTSHLFPLAPVQSSASTTSLPQLPAQTALHSTHTRPKFDPRAPVFVPRNMQL